MRREIPLLITGIVGVVFVVQYFIPHFPFSNMSNWFSDWFAIVQACAIWLGALNLMKISLEKISRRKTDWGYAVVVVVCFLAVIVIGFLDGPASRENGTPWAWMYEFVYTPLAATMFAILAFYVASASYRAFRARNLEATLLLIAAFVMMLGRVPIGNMVTSFMPDGYMLGDFSSWIMSIPQVAGQRAIQIGIALGIISTSLRIILGIERSHLGGD